MSTAEAEKVGNIQADVIVIGGGGSGLSAAVAAAEAGVGNITLLEKARVLGGNARLAGGIFAVESPAQKRLGINLSRDEYFKKHMEYSRWRDNPRIVRAFLNKSGDMVRWLEEKGLNFNIVISSQPGGSRVWHMCITKPLVQKVTGRFKGASGPPIVKTLTENCKEFGVRILPETPAKRIVTNKKGEVIGVLAENKGRELLITAKSAIIATGGFSHNTKLLKKYFPSYNSNVYTHSLPQMIGDGLLMATEAGAATDDTITFIIFGPHHYPWNNHITELVRLPNSVWVNKNGERYIDESAMMSHFTIPGFALSRQPDSVSYTLLDTKILQDFAQNEELNKGLGPETWKVHLNSYIKTEADKGRMKISESWDEIAEYIGAKPEVLKATVEQYNSFCDKGYDADFLKDKEDLSQLRVPPYYAILARQGFDSSIGGIKINHRMEVLDKRDSPIRGLYAVGNDTGGWQGDAYNPALFPGTSFSFALFSGYTAGENAAKYVMTASR